MSPPVYDERPCRRVDSQRGGASGGKVYSGKVTKIIHGSSGSLLSRDVWKGTGRDTQDVGVEWGPRKDRRRGTSGGPKHRDEGLITSIIL